MFKQTHQLVRVTDKTGVVLLQRQNAEVIETKVADTIREVENIINKLTDFGDAGRSLPDIHLLFGSRIINLSGLAEMEQAIALAKTELENLLDDERVVIIATAKN